MGKDLLLGWDLMFNKKWRRSLAARIWSAIAIIVVLLVPVFFGLSYLYIGALSAVNGGPFPFYERNFPAPSPGIKTETVKFYDLYKDSGKLKETLSSTTIVKRDRAGNIVERDFYNRDGSLFQKEYAKYDAKGRKIEEARYDAYGFLYRRIFEYTDEKHQVTLRRENPEGVRSPKGKWQFKFDEDGRLLEVGTVSPSRGYRAMASYKYDEKGNRVEVKEFFFGEESEMTWRYRYSEKGILTEEEVQTGEKFAFGPYKWRYRYNRKGNLIGKELYWRGITPLGKERFRYDEAGNRVEKVWAPSLSLGHKWTYKYGVRGDLIEEVEYDYAFRGFRFIPAPSVKTVIEYEYIEDGEQ